jgi:hypothetical protein
MVVSLIGMTSATTNAVYPTTVVAGVVYDNTNPNSIHGIEGATVIVTCDGHGSLPTTTLEDGAYSVQYSSDDCYPGSVLSVYASHPNYSPNTVNDIDVHNNFPGVNVNLGVANVPLVPEFGLFIGGLTVLGALGAFFVVRRK